MAQALLAVSLVIVAGSGFLGDHVWYGLVVGGALTLSVSAWIWRRSQTRLSPGAAARRQEEGDVPTGYRALSRRDRIVWAGVIAGNLTLLTSLPFQGPVVDSVRIFGGVLLVGSAVADRFVARKYRRPNPSGGMDQ